MVNDIQQAAFMALNTENQFMGQKDIWMKAGNSCHTSVKDAQWN
jgi:hypothetical protein